jgi:hypothetical protein
MRSPVRGVGAAGLDRLPDTFPAQVGGPHCQAAMPVAAGMGAMVVGRANGTYQVPPGPARTGKYCASHAVP